MIFDFLFKEISYSAIFKENERHIANFFYLVSGMILQISVLNFMVYPYLSRHMPGRPFGELLLLMTVINFFISAFGAPLIMAFYRQFGDIPKEDMPNFIGRMIKFTVLGMAILALINILSYGMIASFWNLSFSRAEFTCLLLFMLLSVVDSFLLARVHFDYNFKKGFYSRVWFFAASLFIIPAFIFFQKYWLISFVIPPLLSGLVLFAGLKINNKIAFTGRIHKQYMQPMFKYYLYFFITCLGSQFLIYCDRWFIASFNIAKIEIVYFTIAVQACTLIMFPIEMVGNLMMPSVANKKSLEMITPLQARKAFLAMAGSVILTIPFGIVVGLVFFRLYKPAYFEHIWRYFIVILAATALYPIQTFSRPYLIKFFKAHYIIVSQFVAVVLQITVSMVLLAKYNNAMGAAIGRAVGIAAVSFIFYFICQTHIFKIAFKSMKTRS